MMRLAAICLAALAGGGAFAAQGDLCRVDFTKSATFKADGDWTVTPEGTLLRKSYDGMTSWRPLNWPELAGRDFSVEFEARELLPPDGKPRSGHWGLSFTTADGENGLVFTGGKGVHLVLGKRLGDSVKGAEEVVKISATSRATNDSWSVCRLTVNRGGFRAYLNGKLQRCEPYSIAPLANPSFHGFGRSVEIRNFRVVEEASSKPDFVRAPTLRIDGIVTHREFRVEKPVSALGGGVEFWSRFVPGTACVKLLGENDRELASFYYCGDYRIQADFAIEGSDRPLVFKRRVYAETGRTQAETIHYAFTWGPDGKARFFLNGIPFPTTSFLSEDLDMPVFGNLLDGVKKIVLPPSPAWMRCNQQVSDLRVFRRPLTNREVLDEYRRRMPIDLVFQESLLTAGDRVEVKVAAAPGGYYMQPHPAPGAPLVKAKVDLRFTIEKILGGFRGEPVADGVTELTGVDVSAPVDLALNPLKLAKGDYRLIAEVNGCYTRTLFFTVMNPIRLAEVEPSKDGWRKTGLIFSRDFTKTGDFPFVEGPAKAVDSPTCGKYVECGPDGSHARFDRIGTEVFFPKDSFGRPCLLEIDWPDDKARASGYCLHVECRQGQGPHRDSLMEGIIAGGEIRNQNKLRTTSYLFFPAHTNYLFEVRTMIKNRPAAVAALRAYRLAEPLPRLKVHHPEGLAYRRFGHQDEDQTFYFLLNFAANGSTAGILSELLRYFAYTGESTFQYSFLRYTSTFGSIEGSPGNGMFPAQNGEFGSVLRVFDEHDVEFVGQFCLWGEPHIARLRQCAEAKYRERGFVTLDAWGQDRPNAFIGDAVANIANPELQDLYFTYFEDVLVRNAKAGGFKAVEIPVALLGCWTSPELGYDDWTVRRFARDCSLENDAALKPLLAKAKKGTDYQARYALLWKGALKPRWVRWRAERVTEFFSRLVGFIRGKCPDLKVYLTIPGDPSVYEQRGIDADALLAIDGVKPSLGRNVQGYWGRLFRDNTMSGIYTNSYDAASPYLAKLKAKTGAIDLVRCGQSYFESFANSCDPVGHKAYFQCLDLKPVGRDWLKELAFAIGACDALETAIGNQQLSTLGVENEAREFVQAYSALPAQPFKTIPGSDVESVVGRFLPTANGTYFYFVNMTDGERSVRPKVDISAALDLSSDRVLGRRTVVLKPYELRSFLLPGKKLDFGTVSARDAGYEKLIADVNAEVEAYSSLLQRGGESAAADAVAAGKNLGREGLVYPVLYRETMKLDGALDDWADVPFEGRIDLCTGNTRESQVGKIDARFKAAITDHALYVLLTAKDPVLAFGCSPSHLYQNDCFEFYLDPKFTHAFTMGELVSQTFVTPKDAAATEMIASGKLPWKVAPVKVEGGWGAELELPLDNPYFKAVPFDGLRFGVNLMYCNNDHPGKSTSDGKLGWSRLDTGNASFQTPGVYGVWTVVMAKRTKVTPVADGPILEANAERRREGGSLEDPAILGSVRPEPAVTRGFNASATAHNCHDCARVWGGDNLRTEALPFQVSQLKPFRDQTEYTRCAISNIIAECANAKKSGVKLIVSMNKTPAIKGCLWTEAADEVIRYWCDVIRGVQGVKDVIWGFDLVNEPLDFKQLPMAPIEFRPFFCRAVKAIREVDETSWLIYETGPGGDWDGFNGLLPLPDRRIVYSFHFYKPGAFTHQGVEASLLEDAHLMPEAQKGNNMTYPNYYFGRWFDRDEMERQLMPVIEFQRKWNVPIYVGEFSCTSWGPPASTARWLEDILSVIEKHGWSWSYHNLNGWPGWNLDSADGVLDQFSKIPKTMETGRAKVMLKCLRDAKDGVAPRADTLR